MASAHVLVIEDNPRIGGKLVEVLEARGFGATLATDAANGLALFRAMRPDVVLLELLVPGESGDLVSALRALDDEVPLLVMSTSPAAGRQLAERDAGRVQGFLLKPFRVPALLDALGRALDLGREAPEPRVPAQRAGALDDDHPFAAVLLDAVVAGATGVLRMEKDGVRRAVYLVNGLPVFAESNLLGETFGRYLLHRGVIDRAQYARVQAHMRAAGVRQGEALVALGILEDHEVYGLLRGQVRERVIRCFDWPGATFAFHADDTFVDEKLLFPMNPMNLLVEGTARRLSPRLLQAWFDTHRDQRVALTPRAEPLAPYLARLQRDPPLAGVLADRPTVDGVARALRLVETRAAAILRALSDLDVVEVGAPALGADDTVAVLADEPTSPDEAAGAVAFDDPRDVDHATPSPPDPVARRVFARYLATRGADHFSALGLPHDADGPAVEAAWLTLSRDFHPDAYAAHPDAEVRARAKEIFVRGSVAFGVLADEAGRSAYRASLRPVRPDTTLRSMDAEAHYLEGERLLTAGDAVGARDALARARAGDPDEPLYEMYLGWSAWRAAPDAATRLDAEALLRRAVDRDPANALGHALLARLCASDGRASEAAGHEAHAERLGARPSAVK